MIQNDKLLINICSFVFKFGSIIKNIQQFSRFRYLIAISTLIVIIIFINNLNYSYAELVKENITDIKAAYVGINPLTNKSYLVAPDDNKVYVVNETTNSIIKSIFLPDLSNSGLMEINTHTDLLYIGYGFVGDGFYVINGTNDERIDTIPLNWIHEFKINSFNNKLYSLDSLDNSPNYTLKELDLSTRNISREIILPTDAAYSMEIIPSKELVLIGDGHDGQVLIINASSSLDYLEITDSVRVARTPSDMVASPLNNKVYLINGMGNRISIIDTNKNNTVDTIVLDTPSDPESPSITVDSRYDFIFVSNPTKGTINVVDEKSKKTLTLLNSGIYPTNLIHSQVGDKLYVTSLTEPINILNVSKVMIDEMKLNSSNDDLPGIHLKDPPSSMTIDPENERLYVTYLNKKKISVIDISKDQLTGSISLNFSPTKIAFDPQTNFIYMTSNDTVYVLDTLTNHLLNISLSLNHTIDNLAVDTIHNLIYLHTSAKGYPDQGINSAFQLENNRFHQKNNYSGDRVLHPFPLLSVSNINRDENILSNILPYVTTNVTFSRGFDPVKDLDYDDNKDLAYVLTDWNLYEVDFVTEMAKDIARMDSIFVSDMLFDSEKDVIYVSDSLRNVVQVINSSSGEIINEIRVGNSPMNMVLNPNNGILYVSSTESNLISVINSSSYKPLVPSIIFNINPPNAGYVQCNNGGIVTNQYVRISNDENCEAKSNEGFAFSNWVENFGKNSTKIISSVSKKDSWYAPFENVIRYVADKFKMETSKDAASAFMISHNGNFTANFEKIPPPLPPEYWTTLTTFVLTTIVGAIFIPSFIGFMRTKSKVRKQNNFHKEIQSIYDDGELDNNDIDKLDNLKDKITNSYSAGKISTEQYDNLTNEISISYDEIFNIKIDSIRDDKEFIEKLKPIEEEITKAYSKKKLLELQYKLLKEKIKELRRDTPNGSE